MVYKLKKPLYKLKQTPRAWFSHIDAYFINIAFKKCPYEHILYVKVNGGNISIVCLYMDDLIFIGNIEEILDKFNP